MRRLGPARSGACRRRNRLASMRLRRTLRQERQAAGGAIARRKSFDPDKELCRAPRGRFEAVGSRA